MADYGTFAGLGGVADAFLRAKQARIAQDRQKALDTMARTKAGQDAANEAALGYYRASQIPEEDMRKAVIAGLNQKFPGLAPAPKPAPVAPEMPSGPGPGEGLTVQGPMAPGEKTVPIGPGTGPTPEWSAANPADKLKKMSDEFAMELNPNVQAPAVGAVVPAGMSPKDYSAFKKAEMLKKTAAPARPGSSSATGGFSRGEASLFGKYFTSQDSNKLSSVPNAVKLHNGMLDLNDAYLLAQEGDPNRALAMLKQKAATNDWLKTQIGSVGNNPENIIPVYNAARRSAAIELYKITTGSNAAPSDEAVKHNMGLYPDLGMPREQAQSLFDLATETQIMPAVQGAKNKIGLNRDSKTGKFSSAELDKLYRSLDAYEQEVQKSVHRMKGAGAESIVPGGGEAGPTEDFSHLWK